MNTVKNYATIHLQLNYIDQLEVVILLMAYLVCVPNKTEDLNIHVYNIITGINESKALTRHTSCKCKCKQHICKKRLYLESCYM